MKLLIVDDQHSVYLYLPRWALRRSATPKTAFTPWT